LPHAAKTFCNNFLPFSSDRDRLNIIETIINHTKLQERSFNSKSNVSKVRFDIRFPPRYKTVSVTCVWYHLVGVVKGTDLRIRCEAFDRVFLMKEDGTFRGTKDKETAGKKQFKTTTMQKTSSLDEEGDDSLLSVIELEWTGWRLNHLLNLFLLIANHPQVKPRDARSFDRAARFLISYRFSIGGDAEWGWEEDDEGSDDDYVELGEDIDEEEPMELCYRDEMDDEELL